MRFPDKLRKLVGMTMTNTSLSTLGRDGTAGEFSSAEVRQVDGLSKMLFNIALDVVIEIAGNKNN